MTIRLKSADRVIVQTVLRHYGIKDKPADIIALADYPEQALRTYRLIYRSLVRN